MAPDKTSQPDDKRPALWARLLAAPLRFSGRVSHWAARNRLQAIVASVGVLAMLAMIGIGVGMMLVEKVEPEPITMAGMMEELDAGNYMQAREMARQLVREEQLTPDEWGAPSFVLGAATAYEAETVWDPQDKLRFYLIAARYLEDARDHGFPAGREAEGYYLLGKSLYLSNQFAQAIPILQDAIAADEQMASDAYAYLSGAYALQADPDYETALLFARKRLADRALTADQRDAALVAMAQVLFELNDQEGSKQLLDQVPITSKLRSEAVVIHGRLLMRQADPLLADADAEKQPEGTVLMQEAISLFRQAQGVDTFDNQTTRKAAYLIGLAQRQLHNYRAANEQFARVRRLYYGTPEALAAGVAEAEMLVELGQEEPALEAYRRTFREVGRPAAYSNPWLPMKALQASMKNAYRHYLQSNQFERALDIATSFSPVLSHEYITQLQAETHRAWADYLLAAAENLPADEAQAQQNRAYLQLRQAGLTYAKLARLQITTRQYEEDVWLSATNYLAGRDYERAVTMFRRYLHDETRQYRARALVGLGESLLALDRLDQASAPLLECIEFFPKDPAAYRARILCSTVFVEKNALDDAEQLLSANLHNEALTPQSLEWRDSLFALGSIYHLRGSRLGTEARLEGVDAVGEVNKEALKKLEASAALLRQAVEKLSEAVARYPEAPQAIDARYKIAESHRKAARLPQTRLVNASIETTRVALNREIQEELTAAVTMYGNLQQLLNEQTDKRGLNPVESEILRNCYFAQGAALFDLHRYEEAIQYYSNATNRYQHEPLALEAYVQIASCYRRLNRQIEARGTLEQAKIVLGRINPEADFSETTRYGREEWINLLDWLSTL